MHTEPETGLSSLKAGASPPGVRWRSVALPSEHGGWSFIGEPVLLGLLLAPGFGGLAAGIAAFGAFLLRQPLKLVIKDFRSGRHSARTNLARRFSLVYATLTLIAGLIMLALMSSFKGLLPLLCAMPLVAIQWRYDAGNQSRNIAAEMTGAVAAVALAATIVLMSGWSMPAALALWLSAGLKAVTAIMYVRARLRLERGKPARIALSLIAHMLACFTLIAAALVGLLPWTVPAAMSLLTGRAVMGLSRWRIGHTPQKIGMQEAAFGICFVLLIAMGYWMG